MCFAWSPASTGEPDQGKTDFFVCPEVGPVVLMQSSLSPLAKLAQDIIGYGEPVLHPRCT